MIRADSGCMLAVTKTLLDQIQQVYWENTHTRYPPTLLKTFLNRQLRLPWGPQSVQLGVTATMSDIFLTYMHTITRSWQELTRFSIDSYVYHEALSVQLGVTATTTDFFFWTYMCTITRSWQELKHSCRNLLICYSFFLTFLKYKSLSLKVTIPAHIWMHKW